MKIIFKALMLTVAIGANSQTQAQLPEIKPKTSNMRGDVRNGDGVTGLAADWTSTNAPFKIPEVRRDLIEKMKEELKNVKPDLTYTYSGNFAAEDGLAFTMLEANLYARYEKAAESTRKFAKVFSRAVPTIAHFNASRPEHAAIAYETYRDGLKQAARDVISAFDPFSSVDLRTDKTDLHSWRFFLRLSPKPGEASIVKARWILLKHEWVLDTDGGESRTNIICSIKGDSLARAAIDECGLADVSTGTSLPYIAKEFCVSETCVLEIYKIASELFEASASLDRKYDLANGPKGHAHVFYDPKHSSMRSALTRYIENRVINQNTNLFVTAAIGLVNLAYIPAAFTLDVTTNTRLILTSLNFRTDYYTNYRTEHYDGSFKDYKVGKLVLRQKFEEMAQKLLKQNMYK